MENMLVGKIVTAVYVAADKMAIRFDIRDGEPVIARTDGDCCSHTWIENVDDPEALLGREVTAVRDLDMPDARPHVPGEDDCIAFYGLSIETAGGVCKIDYRNESNGYYGGNMVWGDEYFYGGVFGQNESKLEWELIAPRVRDEAVVE